MDRRADSSARKRSRSRSPPPWHQDRKAPRYNERSLRQDGHQNRHRQTQMDREERDWVAKEDEFVLKQAKKKAQIRVREGRAKPIDWFAVTVAVPDLEHDVLEDDGSQEPLELAEPAAVVDDLNLDELRQLLEDIEHYAILEKTRRNLKFWRSLKALTQYRMQRLTPSIDQARGVQSVSQDVARLLGPKTQDQLDILESQVRAKLRSDEDIDFEYWEHLLDSIGVYKARAELSKFYKNALESIASSRHQERGEGAGAAQVRHSTVAADAASDVSSNNHRTALASTERTSGIVALTRLTADRQRAQRTGFVPTSLRKPTMLENSHGSRMATGGDASQTTNAMYDREAAHGIEDDEEVFTAEAELPAAAVDKNWSGSYKPRKPKYFNRVQMGYEWNKYNQTHYDQDNPPPKVVQGYKFNIFYPDLIDKTKAPTYKILREHGRKRGQSFAPAGEEDACVIRFISGPPYEDLAFRIVDKEWDYSARRERGFKSCFDKGILQLHFQFKKVYYRK